MNADELLKENTPSARSLARSLEGDYFNQNRVPTVKRTFPPSLKAYLSEQEQTLKRTSNKGGCRKKWRKKGMEQILERGLNLSGS